MKRLVQYGLLAITAIASVTANAKTVNWHFEGVIGSLETPRFDYVVSNPCIGVGCGGGTRSNTATLVGYDPASSIGQMSVGQAFTSDFVVDLSNNKVLSATLRTTDGQLAYKDAGPTLAFVPSIYDPASILGTMEATQSGTTTQPWLLAGFVLGAQGTTLPSSVSLLDLNNALASGAYTAVSATSGLYRGYGPQEYTLMGRATYNITVVAVPEASTLSGLTLGLLAMSGLYTRRRRQA